MEENEAKVKEIRDVEKETRTYKKKVDEYDRKINKYNIKLKELVEKIKNTKIEGFRLEGEIRKRESDFTKKK